jgi:outer membrane protein TolC
MMQNGLTESENVDQLQLSVNDINIQMTYAEEQVKLSKDMLKLIIGMPLSQEIVLTETLDAFISQSSADLLSTTFTSDNNLNVQIAKSTLQLQELNLKSKKAAYLPTLSTFINFQTAAYRQQFNLFDSRLPYFYGNLWGINLNVPILSGGQRKNEIKKVEVETRRATDLVNFMQQTSELEFRRSRTELSNALQSYNAAKSSVELAKSIQDKSQIKFSEGIGSSFDVTQRNTQLIQTQGAYVQSMLKVLSAKTRLEKALNQL